jgi:hypothetical protein
MSWVKMIKRGKIEYILIGNDCSVVGGAGIKNIEKHFHQLKKKTPAAKEKSRYFPYKNIYIKKS